MSHSKKPPTIFDQAYWERPTPKPQGAAEPRLLYQAAGETLSQWEHVDQHLADLFLVFVCEPSSSEYTKHSIRRAYGSIISTANRREAIRTASEVYFPDWMKDNKAERKGLTDICNAAGWASKLRDDIAHGRGVENIDVTTTDGKTGDVVKEEHFGTFLMPPEYNTGRTFAHDQKREHVSYVWRARYAYNDQDLQDIKLKFWALGAEITRYVDLITPYVDKVRTTFPLGGRIGGLDAMEAMRKAMDSTIKKDDPANGVIGK